MVTVYNPEVVLKEERRLFLGPELNVQDYTDPKYPKFDWLESLQMDSHWRENETELTLDASQFKEMSEFKKKLATKNLSYQILMDSVQGRAPLLVFLPFISDPSFEACVLSWAFFEKLHSRTYDYILKSVFPNPTEITQGILLDEKIKERAQSVTRWMDRAYQVGIDYRSGKATKHEMMRALYMAMVTTNILESCRFNVSFACNFGLAEQGILEGIATLIEFIARDESYHVAITQNVINHLRSGMEGLEWLDVIEECDEEAHFLWKEARDQEFDWSDHLFEDGSLIGVNGKVMKSYANFKINQRMSNTGFTPFEEGLKNPLPWVDRRMNAKTNQKAPQEIEKNNYRIGAIVHSRKSNSEMKDFFL